MKTIRAKVAVFFTLCLAIIITVTAVYYRNIFSLQKKLIEIESLDDFQNDILELRRYEKNFIYYRDQASLKESDFYLNKIESDSRDVIGYIGTGEGAEDFTLFQKDLFEYKKVLNEAKGHIDTGVTDNQIRDIREKGKALVSFSKKLIDERRSGIQAALKETLHIIPLAFLGTLVIFIVVMLHLLSRGIFMPLRLVAQATAQVGRESFTPIAYQTEREDEISNLINAFNKMARELEARQEELIHSRKLASIGTFTSGIAHELNNPLNNISLTAESLQLEWETLSREEMKDLIDDILAQADRASQVVKNLLDFSRSERPSLKKLQIKSVIGDTLKLVKNQLQLAGIELKSDISPDLPPIDGRYPDLQHVFLNILLNAIDATGPEGTIFLQARSVSGGFIKIDVTDTGAGIKPGDLEHVFDPFFTTKEVGEGTGLGLSLVYGIVRTHGGHIEVKSEMGKGTTFSIFLPATD